MNLYQQYIHKSHYARGCENWNDTVDRYINEISTHTELDLNDYKKALNNLEIAGSMRGLATSGRAVQRDNAAMFNCAYSEINDFYCFSEIMYLLMCGCGAGFELDKYTFFNFPKRYFHNPDYPYIIQDDRISWCDALDHLFCSLLKGYIPTFDYSEIRPKGSPLKIFGGFASGPEVLEHVIEYIIKTVCDKNILFPIDCFDILCKIAEAIQCGGTRRSAMICLTNDIEVAGCKSGDWYSTHPWRRYANISVIYDKKPDEIFLSRNGEPGIFNRYAAKLRTGLKKPGTNPCGEIIMQSKQFCNLSEVVCRVNDTVESLIEKAKLATTLAMIQGTYTNFRFLSSEWKQNAQNDPIIGVSLTGIYDCPSILNATRSEINEIKMAVKDTTEKLWKPLGYFKVPSRATCIKPSGTVSQLYDCSAGIHPRNHQYYIRQTLLTKESPLAKFLEVLPHFDDPSSPKNNVIIQFPMKCPNEVKSISAKEQINMYLKFMDSYVEHNISNTVYVKEDEWEDIEKIVLDNFDKIIGMTFFPAPTEQEQKLYPYLPEQPCTKEEYEKMLQKIPTNLDWPRIDSYEPISECSGALCSLRGK